MLAGTRASSLVLGWQAHQLHGACPLAHLHAGAALDGSVPPCLHACDRSEGPGRHRLPHRYWGPTTGSRGHGTRSGSLVELTGKKLVARPGLPHPEHHLLSACEGEKLAVALSKKR